PASHEGNSASVPRPARVEQLVGGMDHQRFYGSRCRIQFAYADLWARALTQDSFTVRRPIARQLKAFHCRDAVDPSAIRLQQVMSGLCSDEPVHDLLAVGRDLRPDGAYGDTQEVMFGKDLLLTRGLLSDHQLATGPARQPT